MTSSIIIIAISLIFDGILTNFLPYSVGDLSLFTPLLTIISLIIVYPFFGKHKNKEYYITSCIVGFIYDLFYTNLLFYDAIIFIGLAFIISKIYKEFGYGIIKIIVITSLIIIIYESLFALFIALFNLVPISFDKLLYKISHSLILNIIYGEVFYLISKLIPKNKKLN